MRAAGLLSIVAGFAIFAGSCTRTSGPDDELARQIAVAVQAEEATVVNLTSLATFSWDRLFVFPPYTAPSHIEKELGASWSESGRIEKLDTFTLLVFVNGGRVVRFVEQPREGSDFADCYRPGGFRPAGAVFRCAKDTEGWRQCKPGVDAPMGRPLFSCGRANFAWGVTNYGNVLDEQGRIWFYDIGRMSPAQEADGDLYRESALRKRFINRVLRSERVSAARLTAMREMAEKAQHGQIERKHVAYDSGGFGCDAYLWEKPDAYRWVELGSKGDFIVRNSSPEAEQLKKSLLEELGMGRGKPTPP